MTHKSSMKKCARLSLLIAISVAGGAMATSANATPKFDKKIAEATATQVAKRLGDLRGGVDFDEPLEIVTFEHVMKSRAEMQRGRLSLFSAYQPARRYNPDEMKDIRVVYTGTIIEN